LRPPALSVLAAKAYARNGGAPNHRARDGVIVKSNAFQRHLVRHRYFYIAGALGIFVGLLARIFLTTFSAPLSGDTFFFSYLVMVAWDTTRTTPDRLRAQAKIENEGMLLIVLIALAAICFSLVFLFGLLSRPSKPDAILLTLSIATAPLGWLMLHVIAAFHYAQVYYTPDNRAVPKQGKAASLSFPNTDEPGVWDFLYFAFVIGMTAQVSDVQVTTTQMRKLTLFHGIVSFLFNTVLISLAVNIAVILVDRPH
jgi:uncharacterized membrane protein